MVIKISRIALVFITALFLAAGIVHAEEPDFEASVNRNIVPLGQSIQLSLSFGGTTDVPAPDLPEIDGFNARYVGPSTRMSIVNGRMSSSITHIYRLVPVKTGTFDLGPFKVEHEGDTYVSNRLSLKVVDSSSGGSAAQQGRQRPQVTFEDRLFLTMEPEKTEVYMNEAVPLKIKLYMGGLNVKDIQYPDFDHEGFSAEQFGKPRQYKERRGGTIYDVVEFNTTIFATKAGEFSLGPATLGAGLIVKRQTRQSPFDDFFGNDPFDSFFGAYEKEPVELRSEKIDFTVLPLPEKSRPPGYNGAVGEFTFDVNISPDKVMAGDPVTMEMTVSGTGNMSTVNVSGIKEKKHFKVYKPQVRQENGIKIFEQILIPLNSSVSKIPAVSFSFFDTSAGEYRSVTCGPFALKVEEPEKGKAPAVMDAAKETLRYSAEETLGRDIVYIKESPGKLRKKGSRLYKNPVFIIFHIVPLVLLISIISIKRKRDRLRTDISYARRLKAPKKARKGIKEAEQYLQRNMAGEFHDAVFRSLREYIGNRFHLPSGGLTADAAEELLQQKGIDEDICSRVKGIFRVCDMARYAPAEMRTADMEKTLRDLKEVIDHMERKK